MSNEVASWPGVEPADRPTGIALDLDAGAALVHADAAEGVGEWRWLLPSGLYVAFTVGPSGRVAADDPLPLVETLGATLKRYETDFQGELTEYRRAAFPAAVDAWAARMAIVSLDGAEVEVLVLGVQDAEGRILILQAVVPSPASGALEQAAFQVFGGLRLAARAETALPQHPDAPSGRQVF